MTENNGLTSLPLVLNTNQQDNATRINIARKGFIQCSQKVSHGAWRK